MNNKVAPFCFAIFLVFILSITQPNVYVIGFTNLASLFVLGLSIAKTSGRLMSPFLLIAVSLYLFHSGNLWLSLLYFPPSDLLTSFGSRYQTTDYKYILQVYNDVTIMLILFMAAGLLMTKRKSDDFNNVILAYKPSTFFRSFFLFLYIIGFIIEIKRAIAVSSTSYAQGFLYTNAIESHIASFVNVLLLLFLFMYRKDKKMFNYFIALQLIRTFFIMLFVGNRGVSIINLLLTLFIVVNYSYLASNRSLIKRLALFFILSMLFFLPFVSAIRGSSDEVALESLRETGFLVKFLSEFGGSVENVFLAKDFTETVGVTYGLQMLCASLSIIPSSSALFGDVITNNSSLSAILNDFYDRSALGGSLIGQLYFNFNNSLLLYISIILAGFLSSWCSNKLLDRKESIFYYVFYLCLFSGLMTWVRGEWYDVVIQVKLCLYLLLLIYFSKDLLMKRVRVFDKS